MRNFFKKKEYKQVPTDTPYALLQFYRQEFPDIQNRINDIPYSDAIRLLVNSKLMLQNLGGQMEVYVKYTLVKYLLEPLDLGMLKTMLIEKFPKLEKYINVMDANDRIVFMEDAAFGNIQSNYIQEKDGYKGRLFNALDRLINSRLKRKTPIYKDDVPDEYDNIQNNDVKLINPNTDGFGFNLPKVELK